jgi:predicted acetylornithine/succinylornithine family transaminase
MKKGCPARENDPVGKIHPQEGTFMDKQTIIENEQDYVLQTYARPEMVFTHGRGLILYDTEGNEYLDFNAGIAVTALGHSDPAWTTAVAEQAGKLVHVSNLYHTEPQATLAKKLVEHSFADRVYFCNSGAEANEAALKFARKFAFVHGRGQGKSKLVSFTHGFHGRTMGALATTAKEKYRTPFEPIMPGVTFAEFNNLDSAAEAIDEQTCAVILEPIQGEGGIHPATKAFLHGVRNLCDQHGALLIFDEVQCGLGRTGYLWAYELFGVTPDIMTLAKPLAGGLPIGATLVTQAVADTIQPGDHGSTFAAGPLVCTAANVVFDRVSEPEFLARVRALSEHLHSQLTAQLPPDQVVEIRGAGLMVGVELNRPVADITTACVENGVLIIGAGEHVVRLIPPLVVSEAEIDTAVSTLAQAMSKKQ